MSFLSAQPRAQPHQYHKQGPKGRWGAWVEDGLLFLQHSQLIRKLKRPLCYSTYEKNVTRGRGSRYLLSAALVLLWVIRAALGECGSVWSLVSAYAEQATGPVARKSQSAGSSEARLKPSAVLYKPRLPLRGQAPQQDSQASAACLFCVLFCLLRCDQVTLIPSLHRCGHVKCEA